MGNLDRIASATRLGMIKAGTGLTIDADGVASAATGPAIQAFKDAVNPTLVNGTVVITSAGANHTAVLGTAADGNTATFINWNTIPLIITCPANSFMDGGTAKVTSVTLNQAQQVVFTAASGFWFGYMETPPIATTNTAGIVKAGDGLSVASDGTLKVVGETTVVDTVATMVIIKPGLTVSAGTTPGKTTLLQIPPDMPTGSDVWIINQNVSDATVSWTSDISITKFGGNTKYGTTDTIVVPPGYQWRAVSIGGNSLYEVLTLQPVVPIAPPPSTLPQILYIAGPAASEIYPGSWYVTPGVASIDVTLMHAPGVAAQPGDMWEIVMMTGGNIVVKGALNAVQQIIGDVVLHPGDTAKAAYPTGTGGELTICPIHSGQIT